MAETKKFKLVYDKEGTLTGSYSGIPANDDVELIERAVLDGSKDPEPEPIDPINFAHTVVPCDFGLAEEDEEYGSGVIVVSVEPDVVRCIIAYTRQMEEFEGSFKLPFRLTYNNKEYIFIDYQTEEGEEPKALVNLVAVYADDIEAVEHNIFESISVATDMESGDSFVELTLKQ